MKRVLHVSKYYYPFRGGTEQIAQNCVNSFVGKYEQKVICFNDNDEDKTDAVDGIEVIRCGVFKTVASQGLSRSIGKKLKETIDAFVPDIIIFHYPNPFVARYLLKYIPKFCKFAIYWHLDIVKQKFLKQFFIRQNRRLVERADVLIATSPPYVEGSPWLRNVKEKCRVVPNCINVERLQESPEVERKAAEIRAINKNKIICLAVGRHTEYKGFKYLIQAAHLLDDRFQIYITGKGEETENLKAEAGNDKKIHFLGLVDDVVLKGYLTAMDIFCFPSITKNEAFGLALAEGMYYGKPAVTFTIPGSGVNYVSLDGKTGLEVENRNVEKYADALKKLASDKDMRIRMGAVGKKRVEENFLNTQFKGNILKVINEL
ncbi:glycosyltransferase [uncultured Acetatifactor sp.]|jgi:glycosyltransferase involved in cell wall biosynthesis|uniref:glycosyltransferase n=1 Tax=uncultured Acetatifactor sp. TaxID=1671927 RepID=UPI0026076EA0|nr:glycosyltransferase [uncultured Acetatifactor sp.]